MPAEWSAVVCCGRRAHPNLVDAELVLEDADGRQLDAISSYVGLRSGEAQDGLYLINGRPKYLRLVSGSELLA